MPFRLFLCSNEFVKGRETKWSKALFGDIVFFYSSRWEDHFLLISFKDSRIIFVVMSLGSQ